MKPVLAILFLFLTQIVTADTVDNFWNWVAANQDRIANEYPNQSMSNEIYQELVKYDDGLGVIFPSYGAKPKEIVITCASNPEKKERVDFLFKKKPNLNKVIFTAFVQPGMAFLPMQVLGRSVPFENVGVSAEKKGNAYLVTVYSGKFNGIDQSLIGSDLYSFFLFKLGEEVVLSKVADVKILPLTLVSPEIVGINNIGSLLK